MKYSKKEVIERALKNADVIKCVEAIVRTLPRSDPRDIAVDAFRFKFCKVVSEILKENLDINLLENFNLNAKFTIAGKQELLDTSAMNNKILTILCQSDNLYFYIGNDETTYVIINDFDVDGEETSLKLSVYFTGKVEVDELIIKIIDSLRKK